MLFDTHAHLYWESFKEDFDEMIQRCLAAGVNELINVGVDVKTSQTAAEMENDKVKFYSSIGIHPHEATKYFDNPDISIQKDIEKLEEIYKQSSEKTVGPERSRRIVLVGECGLDYLIDPSFAPPDCTPDQVKELQHKLLQAQIDLAKKLNLPLSLHIRDDRSEDPDNSECWDKIIEMTKDHFGIFHCYSGLEKTTTKIMEGNFLVSFAATVTYPKNDYLRETVIMLPLEKIVLETDCPFLPPQSKRGTRNEPQTVKEIAELIADLKGIPFDEVAGQTTENVKKLLLSSCV